MCVTICCAQHFLRSADLFVLSVTAAQHVDLFNCHYVAIRMRVAFVATTLEPTLKTPQGLERLQSWTI